MIEMPSKTRDIDLMAKVEAFFGPDTPLRDAEEKGGRPYEDRPQQSEMAVAVAQCLMDGAHLCVEAPTGVGKSFAYLIPAILLARANELPVVVSTHTIALQEQLLSRDLPVLERLLDVPFEAVLAKGRENYVCTHRLKNATESHQEYLPSADLVPEVHRIWEWAQRTSDGSRADLDFQPSHHSWASVCSEPGICPIEKQQGRARNCFFLNARRQLQKADIIVTNHALFSVDLMMRTESENAQSILPNYQAVIIDEAHTFEDVAARHLGIRVSSYGVTFVLNRLYNARTHRGLLAPEGVDDAVREAAVDARDVADHFFNRIIKWVQDQGDNPLTYVTPGHIPNQLTDAWDTLTSRLKSLVKDESLSSDFRMEVRTLCSRLIELHDGIDVFLKMAQENCAYWFELSGQQSRQVSMHVVPIEVSGILNNVLFCRDFSVVMTSATLAVRKDMSFFKRRIGAFNSKSAVLDSPFDFRTQVDLYVPRNKTPVPNDTARFIPVACDHIKQFILKTGGKAFVLFTSYTMMNEIAETLADFFELNQMNLLLQGRELQRSRMLDIFRKDVRSVIFGTDSFWTGVDVPGESLSNVIIVKLPFQVPSHPLVAARKERIEFSGGNPFREYFLPDAVLKFRQGIGRLIRSQTDRGIIVVLDPRIVHSNYGINFLESIPECRRHVF